MLEQIQKWYREAVDLYGDDWPKIDHYVVVKLETVCDADRAKLAAEFNALRVYQSKLFN